MAEEVEIYVFPLDALGDLARTQFITKDPELAEKIDRYLLPVTTTRDCLATLGQNTDLDSSSARHTCVM